MSKDLERDDFDDLPKGKGARAKEDDYKRVWLYMQSRNLSPSIRNIREALQRNEYKPPSVATSQRWAKKLGLSSEQEASPTKDAETRQRRKRSNRKRDAAPATVPEMAEAAGKKPAMLVSGLLDRMREILKKENSSTQIAIDENRTRMAFNIAMMEFYAETPSLLADPKAVAAFIDSTTIASKLSGGASIDIVLPKQGEALPEETSPGGHPMKTVGETLKNVDQSLLGKFREFQAQARGGQGT